MFKRVLIANRGEIAVRVVRACRDMGITTVALYDASDRSSLHVRLADECVALKSGHSYMDAQAIIEIALEAGVDAIHPGYGFLSEQAAFIRACEQAGITFIGPPSDVADLLGDKTRLLETIRSAGFHVPVHSSRSFSRNDFGLLAAEAGDLGYPLVVKSCSGGRGRATRLVRSPEALEKAVGSAHTEAGIVFGNDRLYLERAILPASYIDVQVVADHHGTLLHLGERTGSIQRNNQKLLAESPAPCLTREKRQEVHRLALDIARIVGYKNVGTVEFVMDRNGTFYFTEVKGRVQVEHPVTEMVSQVDIVREQIEIAAGKRITHSQEDIRLQGWAMECRINAEDPWNNYLPSPGHLRRFRLPSGPNVRVDTYAYSGCDVPVRYDPMLAKVTVWGEDREECLQRAIRSLQDFAISGVRTNLPLFQRILEHPDFRGGIYDTQFLYQNTLKPAGESDEQVLRDLAIAAAIAYLARYQSFQPTIPERLLQGWHRANRQPPGS